MITRRDRGSIVDIWKKLAIERGIVQVLQTRRLTYFGHVTRMNKDQLPCVLLRGYTYSQHPKGRPKKKWLDNICEDCTEMGITV